MLSLKQMINDGFIEIKFKKFSSSVYGARFSFSLDGNTWQPCAIYPWIEPDDMLRSTFWEWNEAVRFGKLKFDKKFHPVYWNLYLNNLNDYKGSVQISIELITNKGIEKLNTFIDIVPCNALYIYNWKEHLPENGWKIENGCLVLNSNENVQPVIIKPGTSGRYKIYFGLKYGILHMRVCTSDEKVRYPFIAERTRPEFQNKCHKEIFWKTVELNETSTIKINPTPLSIREPEKWPFGSIHYIKLVPEEKSDNQFFNINPDWTEKNLALYFEPYSWAFLYNLNTRAEVEEVIKLYKEMGANEIHTQIIRFGSKTLHYSKVVEKHDSGAMMGDDGTFSPGPSSMVRSLDILRETIDLCHNLGITHYANAGLTNCYPGTDFEEKISREHPEWRKENILRFNIPETRRYAAAIIKEFVEWGTDGISIDCMRYPYYHTEHDLLALFEEIHQTICETSEKKKIPLTVRIPQGDPLYYKVFGKLAKQGVIQCIIPSNLLTRDPLFSLKPYLKFKDYGCKVFGIIDGWLIHMGSYFNFQLSLHRYPSDIKKDIRRFFKEGADGIFVYQADLYCADPFTRTIFNWKRRK